MDAYEKAREEYSQALKTKILSQLDITFKRDRCGIAIDHFKSFFDPDDFRQYSMCSGDENQESIMISSV